MIKEKKICISIKNISKKYEIGTFGFKSVFKKNKTIDALKDINLDIFQSDRVGVLGLNGSGKSTLLKLISRVAYPTGGSIDVEGKISSVLEAGAGFNMELSGIDNIFLNGAILGMNRKRIFSKIEGIVDFSELGVMINTPIKRYSTGMMIRLAFAIVTYLDGDIIILDEIMAVADEAFRKKCVSKIITDTISNSRTLLFVSHDIRNIAETCNKIICLNKGKLAYYGEAKEGIKFYNDNFS